MLTQVPDLPWQDLSHRRVLAELVGAGWLVSGAGDWAVGLRSPDGRLVARVCPFDPAYGAFIELCGACAGNRWLPRIVEAADLEGGGSVVFLEYVAPVERGVAEEIAEQWHGGRGDEEFEEVRRSVDPQGRARGASPDSAGPDAVRVGDPVHRPEKQRRRDPGSRRRLGAGRLGG